MKKLETIGSVLLGVVFLTGCSQQPVGQNQPTTQAPIVQKSTQPITTTQPIENGKNITNELSQYGEKTKQKGLADSVVYQAPEIGLGSLVNDSEDKSIGKWYFVRDGKSTEKYLLIIDDKCLIDSVGFMDGSCLKYFSIDKNKNILYDGYNGPSVRIYGKVVPNKSIQVSNITIVQ